MARRYTENWQLHRERSEAYAGRSWRVCLHLPLMDFLSFLSQAEAALDERGGTLLQRHSPDDRTGLWWFTFIKAGCLYRGSFDPAHGALLLDKVQGSFQVGAAPGWRPMESRELAGMGFPEALSALRSILERFA